CAARGITLTRCERSSGPLSAVSTAASSAPRASMPSAIACSTAARSFGGVPGRPHRGRHLALAAARHRGERLLVDGGQVGENGGGRYPPAADPVPRVDLDPGHVRGAHEDLSTF